MAVQLNNIVADYARQKGLTETQLKALHKKTNYVQPKGKFVRQEGNPPTWKLIKEK